MLTYTRAPICATVAFVLSLAACVGPAPTSTPIPCLPGSMCLCGVYDYGSGKWDTTPGSQLCAPNGGNDGCSCDAPPSGSASSSSSGMPMNVCAPGTADCDHEYANGCETAISVDPSNCGTCGVACSVSEACVAGACVACVDNVNGGKAWKQDGGLGIGGVIRAWPYTPSDSILLTEIILPIGEFDPPTTTTCTVYIYDEAGVIPGNQISMMPWAFGYAIPSDPVQLDANHNYWIGAECNNDSPGLTLPAVDGNPVPTFGFIDGDWTSSGSPPLFGPFTFEIVGSCP